MAQPRCRLILFARFPVAGKAKTRLIPALGAEGAAALHRRLVLHSLRTADSWCQSQGVELEIHSTNAHADAMQHWLGDGWRHRSQCEGDLGRRMAGAFADSFRDGSPATIIIGSDCPSLTSATLSAARELLRTNPVVFGPATDGGYYLVGLSQPVPELFRGIAWGTERVLAQSLEVLARLERKPALLEMLDDIDRPGDVAAWNRLMEAEDTDLGRISVVIPALNEAIPIVATLESVRRCAPYEIIVVDGGSADETRAIARKGGATVIDSRAGRARQMNAGAARATGHVLLFLHADTVLPSGWARVVRETLGKPRVIAGSFGFRVAEAFRGHRLLEWTTNLRSRWLQSPYGDQAQYLRRAVFEGLGGFANLPIMEDYELNRRLRRLGRVVTAEAAAITSGRRWKRLGIVRTTLVNRVVIAGYHFGVCPHRLARFYRRSRVDTVEVQ